MMPARGLDRIGILRRNHCEVSQSLIQVAKKALKATVGNAGPTNDGSVDCYQRRNLEELETIDL